MIKRVAANIKAAISLILSEDIAALRTFTKNATDSVYRFIGRGQGAVWRNKKKK
jgi:hypothetical protein